MLPSHCQLFCKPKWDQLYKAPGEGRTTQAFLFPPEQNQALLSPSQQVH